MSDEFVDLTERGEEPKPTKICASCGFDLPLDDYQRDRSKPTGRHASCRNCRNAAARKRNQDKLDDRTKIVGSIPKVLDDQQKLNAQANLLAMRELAENHWIEFQRLAGKHRERLGFEHQKKWTRVV